MKNSTWFEYKHGQPIETFLKETTGREFPANTQKRDKKEIEEWECRWCSHLNAIGLADCEKCKFPR